MAFSLVAHSGAASVSGAAVTTSGIDTSGADLIVVAISQLGIGGTLTDSKSNTWTALTAQGGAGFTRAGQLFYCASPTVGSGHTFTFTCGGSGFFCGICVEAFSGVDTGTPFDAESGAAGGVPQPGSITPAGANELFVAGLEHGDATSESVDSGFTITDDIPNAGNAIGCSMSYLIETTATAQNPTWSPANSPRPTMAAFVAAAGGGGGGVAVGADALHYYREHVMRGAG